MIVGSYEEVFIDTILCEKEFIIFASTSTSNLVSESILSILSRYLGGKFGKVAAFSSTLCLNCRASGLGIYGANVYSPFVERGEMGPT